MDHNMDDKTVSTEPTERPAHASLPPKGAFAFVMLLLLFYIGYYAIHWFEIFVMRSF